MPHLSYALRFRGEATSTGVDGNVLRIAATAPGCVFETRAGSAGLAGSLRELEDGAARYESEVVRTGASTFQESGTIDFGTEAHRLWFSTVGSGWIGPAPPPWRFMGAAIWRIDKGEGQLAGAHGLIASIFRLSHDNKVVTNQLGAIDITEAIAVLCDVGTTGGRQR